MDSEAAQFQTIVVISIDALHPDALVPKHAPITCALLEKGHLTRKGISTTPPKTLVAHSAMLTGVPPQKGGRTSNQWNPGEPTVSFETLFHDAKRQGFRTGFYYSKSKLGFLLNDAIDESALSPDNSTENGARFLSGTAPRFAFIHISGLDIVGPQFGWNSPKYLEELSYIDQYLAEVYAAIDKSSPYLLIITSDHAGHGHSHGGSHPEEARLPFGVVSNVCDFSEIEGSPYRVSQLRDFIRQAMNCKPLTKN